MQYYFRILAVLISLFYFFPSWSGAEQEALDIFVESCRNSGENLNIIHSGYAEFEVAERRFAPSEEMRKIRESIALKIKEQVIAKTKERLANANPEALKMNIERIEKTDYYSEDKKLFRYQLLFTGNDIFFNLNDAICKRYQSVVEFHQGEWLQVDFIIMKGSPNGAMVLAGFLPGAKTATVEAAVRPGYEFQRFGRMHMSPTYQDLLGCMEEQDRKKFQITDKTIQAFKGKMKGKNYSFETAGTDTYDGDKTATVVEIKSGQRVVERFWIDPSRGYICPLIQCFNDKGEIEREGKSSGYLQHDKTGLWYPDHYEKIWATPTNPLVGTMETVYTLDRATFQLNQPVSDKMFTLDIPEGIRVIDKRNNVEGIPYSAIDKGELSLVEGGLDLEKMKWLMREGDIAYGSEAPSAAVRWFHYTTLPLGILFIILALYLKYRQWKGQTK